MKRDPFRNIDLRGTAVVTLFAITMFSGAVAKDPPRAWVPEVHAPQYVALRVKDVDVSVKWYRNAFGLDRVDDSQAEDGSWRIVNLANRQLAVEIIRDDRAKEADRARGFFKVGFRVPDVRLVADRVERATEERPRIVESAGHGVRILQLRDPDGNIIQLTSPLDRQEQREPREGR